MLSFFKKIKNSGKIANQFCLKDNIKAKLVFYILKSDQTRYVIQYNILSIKNDKDSIVVLAEKQNDIQYGYNDIESSVCKQKTIAFDLSNLNKNTQIYYYNDRYIAHNPLVNYYIMPCGIVTCMIKTDDIDEEHVFNILYHQLLNTIAYGLPSDVIKKIKE